MLVPVDCEWVRRWSSVDADDVLHQPCTDDAQWTTVNLGEVFPGVPTPLNWFVLGSAGERGLRAAMHAIGTYTRTETQIPDSPAERTIGIQWGRAVANLDKFRDFADRSPGNSGDAMEAQIFGSNQTQGGSRPVYSRYPFVLTKLPVAAWQRRRKMDRLSTETEHWWRASVFSQRPHDRLEATELLWDAFRRISDIFDPHNVMMMVTLGIYQQVNALTAKTGLEGLEKELLYTGETTESETVADVWRLSRGELSLDTFLRRHGFHGPSENEVSGKVWREDDGPLQGLLTRYRAMDDSASPLLAGARRLEQRQQAEERLFNRLKPRQRPLARLILRLARYYVPTRETGRDAFLKGMDVVRYCARVIGAELVCHGLLEHTDDAFYLTPIELTELPHDLKRCVTLRRQKRAEYEQLQLPERWSGLAQPEQKVADTGTGKVEGLGVSAGVVEGRVRVVLDPAADELEDGEILVCRTTDPGWASYFFIASGLVIDIGGPLSHGAIIARELGLPCVINARNATQRLRTGDLVRIDGTKGTVEVLEPALKGEAA
jgi:phosphohistidine swiveling domain-containing protein